MPSFVKVVRDVEYNEMPPSSSSRGWQPPPQSNSSSESPTAALSSSSFQMNMSGQKGVDGVECAQITNPERYCHSHHQPHLTGVGSGRLVEANQVIITNSDDAYRAINVDDCQSVIGNENNESDGVFLPVGREIASETVKGQATSQPGSSSSMTLKRKKRREDDAITLMPGLVGDERSGVGEGGGEVYFRMKAADETKESDATRNEGAVNYGEIGVTAASTANDVGASVANNNDELAKEVAVAAAVEQRIEVADNAVTVSILDYSDGGYCNEDGVPSASKGIRGNDIIDADGDIFDNDDVGEIRGDEVGHVRDDGTKAASTAGETPGAKSRGVEVIEVIEVNDDDDDSVHWRINVEDNVEEDDDNVRSMNRDHRKIIVPPRMDASSIDNPTNTTILAAVGVESCTTEGEGDGRSDEPNGNLTDCEIAPEEGRTEEQRVKGTIESDKEEGKVGNNITSETPNTKNGGMEVIDVNDDDDYDSDDSIHWKIHLEEDDDDDGKDIDDDNRDTVVSSDNREGRSDEPNRYLNDRKVISNKVMAEEQRVKCDFERGEEGGKAGKIIRRSATSTSAFRHSVPADSESNTERGNQREGIERMNILPDEHTDALRTTVADFVLHFHNLLKGDKSRSDEYQLMKLLKVNIPIISAIVPTTIDEMTKLGLEFTSSTKSKKRWKWMNLLINALLERINSFIESRKLAHHLKAKTRWPSDYWRQYQFELPREESNPLTSAPVLGQLRHTMPVVPNKRARCNIGIDAGAAHNPSSTLCANSGSTGDPSQNYRENQTPARERFSEYRIDNAASIAELESIRRRLLNLVDRVDARLKDMRFAEAMSSIFGKETIDELSTQELMDILSQEIDKSAQAGSCNSASSNANGRGITKEALEDAIIRDKAGKRRRYPVTCPLCFDRITSPTLIACEICDEDGICNNCHVNCSSCHRSTCADCLMSCDGCGSSYNCSDCVAVRSGKCIVCLPKAKNQSYWLPGHALINQGSRTNAKHIKNVSSLSRDNQMIRLPQFHSSQSRPFPRTTAHPAKAATSEPSHSSNEPSQLYSIHRFIITEAGTIGINLTKQTRKCLICTVHNHSIASNHGIEEGDEILDPRRGAGMVHPDVYNLFIKASKHRPLLFEAKRYYKPQNHKHLLLQGCYSLHRFVITKPGRIGMFLESENSIIRFKSVVPNSLGALYGLMNDDILCKPLTNGELERDAITFIQVVKSGVRPLIIEVWRAIIASPRDTILSSSTPESTSGMNENPFIFSFPTEEITMIENKTSDDPSKITHGQ